MATLTVRDVPDETRQALKELAARHNRSMEAEVRRILEEAVKPRTFAKNWLEAARALRGPDLELPARSVPREVDLE
ncbi:MAG: Arc family DNA-binding protein [Nocardioides sp.]